MTGEAYSKTVKWEYKEESTVFYRGFGQEFILDIEKNPKELMTDLYPVTNKDIISAYSGVRPLIRSRNNFNKSSRDFFIQQDSNLISIFGGKWTTSPSIARKIATIV